MSKPVPPRNWKRYGWCYAAHAAQGCITVLLLAGPHWLIGLALFGAYLAYQTLEFCRRGDTPARDVKDYMIGMGLAVAYQILFSPGFSLR